METLYHTAASIYMYLILEKNYSIYIWIGFWIYTTVISLSSQFLLLSIKITQINHNCDGKYNAIE